MQDGIKQLINVLDASVVANIDNGHRYHLGASVLGDLCTRKLWYSFRWVQTIGFEARMLRLFDRGHREETTIIEEFRQAGIAMYDLDKNGNQYRTQWADGHCGGSLDAVAVGLPYAPNTPILCEMKTHKASSFGSIKNKGFAKSKHEHLTQMYIYMEDFNLTEGLYIAVNKDTDERYYERVPALPLVANHYKERGSSIVRMSTPPKTRACEKPSYYPCSLCDYKLFCWTESDPERNCRTCTFSTPTVNSWRCFLNGDVGTDFNSCPKWIAIPQLING